MIPPAMLSIIVPVYKSEDNLPRLFKELERLTTLSTLALEVVFVDDGSPDRSGQIVEKTLSTLLYSAQLVRLSRNFGSFPAIAAGLQQARGDYFAVLSADLQEPPELMLEFARKMQADEADVVFGVRTKRDDSFLSTIGANVFWWLYRKLVNSQIPAGGVDVFGCNRAVRDRICSMREVESSLVGLLFWIGYRRGFVEYERRARQEGKSAWTFSKKIRYLLNSVFNFTGLPIRALLVLGTLGMGSAVAGAVATVISRFTDAFQVPGYAATMVAIFFFGGLTATGLGIVGQYLWLCLQHTRNRPMFIVQSRSVHEGEQMKLGLYSDDHP
jgi:polyisoprenyl-phosphate glycosyltransferase